MKQPLQLTCLHLWQVLTTNILQDTQLSLWYSIRIYKCFTLLLLFTIDIKKMYTLWTMGWKIHIIIRYLIKSISAYLYETYKDGNYIWLGHIPFYVRMSLVLWDPLTIHVKGIIFILGMISAKNHISMIGTIGLIDNTRELHYKLKGTFPSWVAHALIEKGTMTKDHPLLFWLTF